MNDQLAEKALELLKKPAPLTVAVFLILIMYALPLGIICWQQSENTNRIVNAINAQGSRYDSLVNLVLQQR